MLDHVLRISEAVLVVYSYDSRESFERIPFFIHRIQDVRGNCGNVFIVAQKMDLVGAVEFGEIDLGENSGLISWLEVSAKSGYAMEYTVETVVRAIDETRTTQMGGKKWIFLIHKYAGHRIQKVLKVKSSIITFHNQVFLLRSSQRNCSYR